MKSTTVAYVLLLFLGLIGGHKFYLGDIKGGMFYILLFVCGAAGIFIWFGIVIFVILLAMLLRDFFTLPIQIAKANATTPI